MIFYLDNILILIEKNIKKNKEKRKNMNIKKIIIFDNIFLNQFQI